MIQRGSLKCGRKEGRIFLRAALPSLALVLLSVKRTMIAAVTGRGKSRLPMEKSVADCKTGCRQIDRLPADRQVLIGGFRPAEIYGNAPLLRHGDEPALTALTNKVRCSLSRVAARSFC